MNRSANGFHDDNTEAVLMGFVEIAVDLFLVVIPVEEHIAFSLGSVNTDLKTLNTTFILDPFKLSLQIIYGGCVWNVELDLSDKDHIWGWGISSTAYDIVRNFLFFLFEGTLNPHLRGVR